MQAMKEIQIFRNEIQAGWNRFQIRRNKFQIQISTFFRWIGPFQCLTPTPSGFLSSLGLKRAVRARASPVPPRVVCRLSSFRGPPVFSSK